MKRWAFGHILPEEVFIKVFNRDVNLLSKYVRKAIALKLYDKDLAKRVRLYQDRHVKLGFKVHECLYPQAYVSLILKGCHYCGKELISDNGIRLDRIDNSKGYEALNVLPCCFDCNMLRGNRLTVYETERVVALLKVLRDANKSLAEAK